MNISSGVLGFLRTIAGVALWAAVMAVLGFLSDATHFPAWIDGGLATLIAGLAGMVEHQMEAKGGGAFFGAVRRK